MCKFRLIALKNMNRLKFSYNWLNLQPENGLFFILKKYRKGKAKHG